MGAVLQTGGRDNWIDGWPMVSLLHGVGEVVTRPEEAGRKLKMRSNVKEIPEGYQTVTPGGLALRGTARAILIAAAALSLTASPGCALRGISLELAARRLNAAHPYSEPFYSNPLWSLDNEESLFFLASQDPVHHRVTYGDAFVLPENSAFTLGYGRIEEVDDISKPSRYILYRLTLGDRRKPIRRVCDIHLSGRSSFGTIRWLNAKKISGEDGSVIELERCAVESAATAPAPMTQIPFVARGYHLEVEGGYLALYDNGKRVASQINLPVPR